MRPEIKYDCTQNQRHVINKNSIFLSLSRSYHFKKTGMNCSQETLGPKAANLLVCLYRVS